MSEYVVPCMKDPDIEAARLSPPTKNFLARPRSVKRGEGRGPSVKYHNLFVPCRIRNGSSQVVFGPYKREGSGSSGRVSQTLRSAGVV